MSAASEAIADLDAALAEIGETVRLRRLTLGPNGAQIPFEVTCLAFVRGMSASDLQGSGQTQQTQAVVLSATQIADAHWPGATPRGNDRSDPRVPVKGDQIITIRGALTVMAAVGIYIQGELVRIDAEVKG